MMAVQEGQFMPLSEFAESGTAVMGLLAKSPKRSHTAQTIAKETKLSSKVASKILKMLTFSGLLAKRGDGYCLKKEPGEIYVAEILAALDKPSSRATHPKLQKPNPLMGTEAAHPIIYQSRLTKLTLADILRPEPGVAERYVDTLKRSQPVLNSKGGPKHH
jgi:DNA-binding IscR family transcriptional regulator